MATDSLDGVLRRMQREMGRHQSEVRKVLGVIERSPLLTLLERSATGDRLLVNFECKALRTRGDGEPFVRENTVIEVLAPPIEMFRLTRVRVATELLPKAERAFNPHILDDERGIICVGDKWTPSTYALDLLALVQVYDILRGANVRADPHDTFNPRAVSYYQRARVEGRLPLDDRRLL
jgi:hypothetical protein